MKDPDVNRRLGQAAAERKPAKLGAGTTVLCPYKGGAGGAFDAAAGVEDGAG